MSDMLLESLAKLPFSPVASETVSKLGLLSGFVRVSSCDFVDRLLRTTKARSTKSHELTLTNWLRFHSPMTSSRFRF